MMRRILIYNFSAEVDDLSHLFPNERLAQLAAIIRQAGAHAEIWDRGNIRQVVEGARPRWQRAIATRAGRGLFRRLSRHESLGVIDKLRFALPLKAVSGVMERGQERYFLQFMREEAARIREGGFDIVLLNLWQGGFVENMALARDLKDAGGPTVYAIGQRVDWFQEHILHHYPQVDGIILGLGYATVRGLAEGRPVDALTDMVWRRDDGTMVRTPRSVVDVDNLPSPIYDAAVYRDVEHLIPLIHLTLSNQACPNRCAFCPRPSNYGHQVRRRPLAGVLDEMESLIGQGYRHFRFADSTPPPRLLTDFARGLIDRGLHERGIHITAFSRVDQNREEDFGLLRRACFESLFFGLESLDDGALKAMSKGITYEGVRQTLMAAHDAGLFVVGSLIFPLPGTTDESRRTTLQRLRELSAWLDSVLIQPAGVYPSSEWGAHPDRFGIRLPPNYIEAAMNYPVKYIVPMRFWPPFPFSYPIFGRPAEAVTFDDIRETFERFSGEVWEELGISNVQDYTLLVAGMLGEDPYALTERVKEILVTRDTDGLAQLVQAARRHWSAGTVPVTSARP